MRLHSNINMIVIAGILFLCSSCNKTRQSEKMLQHFIDSHVEKIKPIERKYNEAQWQAYSGKGSFADLLEESKKTDSMYRNIAETPEYYQSLLNNVYDNASEFEMLKNLRKADLVKDPMLKKQLDVLFYHYLAVNSESSEAEQIQARMLDKFYRLQKNEQKIIDSLTQVGAKDIRHQMIEQYMVISKDYRAMLKALNIYAGQFGYSNYFEMAVSLRQIDYASLDSFIASVKAKTEHDYTRLLAFMDDKICQAYRIEPNEITPGHYDAVANYLMLPPSVLKEFDKDSLIQLVEQYFALGNFETGDMRKLSDIWYADDKMNQAFFFCADTDQHDYRIYANVKPNTQGLLILLHELGHLVHFKYTHDSIPYLLKEPDVVATEAIASYYTNKLYHSSKLRSMAGFPAQTTADTLLSGFKNPYQLFFIRFIARNTLFEKMAFENPDQDLNKLWWKLTSEFMLFNFNAETDLPEWVTSRHIIYSSAVNTNYLYATAVAAQLEHYFPDDRMANLHEYMSYGNALSWNELLNRTTGEKLNIDYLINSY
ncbi:MAG: hypothetical protein JXR50_02445 [Prolixibacteraceae bacterium]|nr:hypothetical protein [Prolixibacteraceae bacterium]MBN2648579.1 hypothetical protein [Prolixibacteraceae bacterium]